MRDTHTTMRAEMNNKTVAVIVALAIVLAFAAGFGTSTTFPKSSSSITTTSSTISTISTVCTIPVEGNLILQVLNSTSGKPIGSVPVHVEYLAPDCSPNPHTIEDLGLMSTDTNGTLTIGGLGEYYFNVSYFGSYSVEAGVEPVRATCVTLSTPSTEVHIAYSQSFQSSC